MARPIEWMGNGRPLPADQYPATSPFGHNDDYFEALDNPELVPGLHNLPALSSPPSYSTLDTALHHQQAVESGPIRPSFPLARGYQIRHALSCPGLSIYAADIKKSIFYIGRYSAMDTPDMIFFTGHDSKGEVLGQAKIFPAAAPKNMEICVGESATGWQDVSSVVEGKVFHTESWHFSTNHNATHPARSLCWKPTHDAHLGSGRFRSKDFKLVDAQDDSVLAVWIDSTACYDGSVGDLEWKVDGVSEEVVLESLIVLMAIRERARRRARQVGRAVVNGAHQFPGRSI
nr:hypothetical protein B0A51_11400 [Rachicladosporium sp. CCFEE 5018]